MSALVELKTEEEWNKHSAEVPNTTLQVIYFKAEWAAPVSLDERTLQTISAAKQILEAPC